MFKNYIIIVRLFITFLQELVHQGCASESCFVALYATRYVEDTNNANNYLAYMIIITK